jgi:hypothetical protein
VQLASSVRKMALFIFIGIPAVCVCLAGVFGAFLAWVEGWLVEDCFWIVLAEARRLPPVSPSLPSL